MTEWVRSTLLVAAGTVLSLVGTLGQQYLSDRRHSKEVQRKFFREKLLGLYSEIAALVATDIDYAQDQVAQCISIPNAGQQPDRSEWATRFSTIHEERRKVQRKLYSLSFQVRLLERDSEIVDNIKKLVNEPPFMMPVGEFWDVFDRSKKFQEELNNYETRFHNMCERISVSEEYAHARKS